MSTPPETDNPSDSAHETIGKNISAVERMRLSADKNRLFHQRVVDTLAEFVGGRWAVSLHLIGYGSWILHAGSRADRIMERLETIGLTASLESIFVTVLILSYQRRMDTREQRNADLHLQMSLLAEQEITRLARVTDAIARHLKIDAKELRDLDEVKEDVDPEKVLREIERRDSTLQPARTRAAGAVEH